MGIDTNVDKNKYPFGPCPELRLHLIERWAIIKTTRRQTVAEHSYNVAVITKLLCKKMFADWRVWYKDLMIEAIEHDQDEIYTGDIPTPCKNGNSDTSPIVKLADLIEAYVFLKCNCDDTGNVEMWCLCNLKAAINNHCNLNGFDLNMVSELMEKLSL